MLITVSALMVWGLPVLQEMEQQSQHRAILSAFSVLDGIVDEVLPEEGSSREARIPLSGGHLQLSTDTDVFAVAWSPNGDDVTYADLADDDADVDVTASGSSFQKCRFTHFFENGTQRGSPFTHDLGSSTSADTCTADRDLDETHRVEVLDSADAVVHEVWLFHAGRIRYLSDATGGIFRVDYHNGAVATDVSGNDWVVNDPLILKLEPDGLTVGLIDLNGTSRGLGGGEGIARIEATLASTHVRTDAQTVHTVDLYPLGGMAEGWTKFLNRSARYELAHTAGDDHARYDPAPAGTTFPVTLTHFVVEVEGRGVGA